MNGDIRNILLGIFSTCCFVGYIFILLILLLIDYGNLEGCRGVVGSTLTFESTGRGFESRAPLSFTS